MAELVNLIFVIGTRITLTNIFRRISYSGNTVTNINVTPRTRYPNTRLLRFIFKCISSLYWFSVVKLHSCTISFGKGLLILDMNRKGFNALKSIDCSGLLWLQRSSGGGEKNLIPMWPGNYYDRRGWVGFEDEKLHCYRSYSCFYKTYENRF